MVNDILITTESLKTVLPVFEDSLIEKTKQIVPKTVEPLNDDIPNIFITGTIPDSKTYVSGELEYISKTMKFHAYTLIKLQGTSSMEHPKKNFTINLYKDKNRSIILNQEFKNWGMHNNFVLKADYIDILHARNVVSAKLWSKVIESRSDYDSLPEELRNSPSNGAIDGFPVKIYINGVYQGLYNWTIPKCDWQFGMSDDNVNQVVLSAEMNDNGNTAYQSNPCNFNTLWDSDENYWSIEVGNNNDAVVSSLNAVIQSIINQDKTALSNVLDIQSTIDYYIFQEIILGTDNLAKNMLMATYDMKKWYLSAYDLDSTFDLSWEGQILKAYNTEIPNSPYQNQYSALLTFILSQYRDEYIARYAELRKTVLSYSSIINMFEEYINIYGEDLYIQDAIAYPDIPSVTTNTLSTLRNFVKERLGFLDSKYEVVS